MVVINTDSEAPFFKAADYGIVGDAFEVVPKMIDEIKVKQNEILSKSEQDETKRLFQLLLYHETKRY